MLDNCMPIPYCVHEELVHCVFALVGRVRVHLMERELHRETFALMDCALYTKMMLLTP